MYISKELEMYVFHVEDKDLNPALKEGKPWRGLLRCTICPILSFLKTVLRDFFQEKRK